ncbi:hypothetical protein AWB67_03983 [Caballeronia terrestris]|uniref:Antibiotic biosynthesis monooxygenase n=1 Tax=Caballeronia terrestris TaxID=1226301 RepID=A0A158JLF7_9BURK|nr:hypothetical protein [Caballeronia terrestris]SAL69704.1 hypothetical protein AWB67_03983 [Caballeronia terrestris]
MTIEVVHKYDLLPGADQQAYGELTRKAAAALLRATGLVEIRADRNLLGSPHVKATSVWRTLVDWEAAKGIEELAALEAESRRYVTNVSVEIWGPSQLLTHALRPQHQVRRGRQTARMRASAADDVA